MKSGSQDKRVETLRRITDLFAAEAERFNDREIDVFDGILEHLINKIEHRALAELSRRLGPIKNAPCNVVQRLARDEDIAVAGPVLKQSTRLSDADLIEIANSRPQAHLLAISGRAQIDTSVTDVLLQRGDNHVFHKLAENENADFSDHGFATLVKHSESDEQLAEKIGFRRDVPLPIFRELLRRATKVVRLRLLGSANPDAFDRIHSALEAVSGDEQREASSQHDRDFAEAYEKALALHSNGEISESKILEYARMERYADMLAALSLLSGAPMQLVENILQSKHREAFLIPCKAAGLRWSTVCIMMTYRANNVILSGAQHDSLRTDYLKLSETAAARVLSILAGSASDSKESRRRNELSPANPA